MIKALNFLNILIAGTMLVLFAINYVYYGGNHSVVYGTWADHFFQKRLLAAIMLTIPMVILLFLLRRKQMVIAGVLTIVCFGVYYFIINALAD